MGVSVLVIDDDQAIRALLVRLLASIGVSTVVEALDGDEAIAKFQDGAFDLTLVDWDMPGRNGLAVVEAIRRHDPSATIVMISAQDQKEDVIKAVQAGAGGYILKPFDAAAVREKLDALCRAIGVRKRNAGFVSANVMTREVVTISENTTARQAIEMLLEHKISGMPVVDADDQLVGQITEYQLLQALFRPELRDERVDQFMTTDVTTAPEDALLFEVAGTMLRHRLRRIPVTRDGRVVGIIARRDLLRYFLEHEDDLAAFVASVRNGQAVQAE